MDKAVPSAYHIHGELVRERGKYRTNVPNIRAMWVQVGKHSQMCPLPYVTVKFVTKPMSYVAALHLYQIKLGTNFIQSLRPLWLGQGRRYHQGGKGGRAPPNRLQLAPAENLQEGGTGGAWDKAGVGREGAWARGAEGGGVHSQREGGGGRSQCGPAPGQGRPIYIGPASLPGRSHCRAAPGGPGGDIRWPCAVVGAGGNTAAPRVVHVEDCALIGGAVGGMIGQGWTRHLAPVYALVHGRDSNQPVHGPCPGSQDKTNNAAAKEYYVGFNFSLWCI